MSVCVAFNLNPQLSFSVRYYTCLSVSSKTAGMLNSELIRLCPKIRDHISTATPTLHLSHLYSCERWDTLFIYRIHN